MPKASINEELTDAEAALTSLAQAIERKITDAETRAEYYMLLQQASLSLNKMRSTSELTDWFANGGLKSAMDKLKEIK